MFHINPEDAAYGCFALFISFSTWFSSSVFSLTGIDFGEFVFPSFPPLIFFLCFASKISFHLRQLVLCERTFEIRHKYSIWMIWYGMGKWEHWKLSSFINHYLSDSCLRLWYVVWTIQRYKLQEQFLSPVYCGFCLVFSKKNKVFFCTCYRFSGLPLLSMIRCR